ncbi:hypothetical protein PFISCL1PPCAC_18284 [Pristionchus fissidentatus]|uniref:F-box domain-containing protein n=1 Tax=Pristionchus fissidentatus TaxID=1538716 RepID=A0AAV5W7L6_9BILA|nr:hypothetical protein PFISCL1PPCAC_18284 [Pristionchus fissidentatus]
MEDPPEKRRRRSERIAAQLENPDFLNLPDEIIEIIFSNLDFASRSKARVNRRLASIESKMKVEKRKIHYVDIESSRAQFKLLDRNLYGYLNHDLRFSLASFERIARYFEFGHLTVELALTKNHHWNLIEKLPTMDVQSLIFHSHSFQFGQSVQRIARFNLPMIREFMENIDRVIIYCECTSISVDDVSSLRELIRGSEKKIINIGLTRKVANAIADQWMGLRLSRPSRDGSITRSNATIEVYGDVLNRTSRFHNFDGLLETCIEKNANGVQARFRKHSSQNTVQRTVNSLHRL